MDNKMRKFFFCLCLIVCSLWSNCQNAADSLLSRLYAGDDDIQLVLDLYSLNGKLSQDSLDQLILLSNTNFLRHGGNVVTDSLLRQIYFSDQYYRISCYTHKQLGNEYVLKNDSVLQQCFLRHLKLHPELDLLKNSWYQKTFDLLLIHSVANLSTGFFKENFYKFSGAFSNDFIEFNNLKGLIDIYLKFSIGKQYFETGFGKGQLSDGTFGLLPKISNQELNVILQELNVKGARY